MCYIRYASTIEANSWNMQIGQLAWVFCFSRFLALEDGNVPTF